MPRFFIDFGSNEPCDVEFIHVDAAVRSAIRTLTERVREALPEGKASTATLEVRDETGKTLYSADIDFRAEWH